MAANTPTSGYSGADSFTYTLSDGTDVSSFTVFVTVNPGAGGENPKGPLGPLQRDPPVVLPRETEPGWQPISGDAPLSGGTTSIGSLMGNLNGIAGVITANGPILDVVNAIHPLQGIGSLPDRGAVLDSVRRIGEWIESGRRIDELTAGFFKGGSNIHHAQTNGEHTWFTIDTIFYKDYLYIMPSSAGGLESASFGVTLADGKALPNWLQPTAQGLVIGRPPADQQFIDLRVHGSSKDGVISDTVRIDLHTGAVLDHVMDQRTELHGSLFSQSMLSELDLGVSDIEALSAALARSDDARGLWGSTGK